MSAKKQCHWYVKHVGFKFIVDPFFYFGSKSTCSTSIDL